MMCDKAPATLLRPDGQDSGLRAKFEKMIRLKQDEICSAVEALDGKKFREDTWTRPAGGGAVRLSRCIHTRTGKEQTGT